MKEIYPHKEIEERLRRKNDPFGSRLRKQFFRNCLFMPILSDLLH